MCQKTCNKIVKMKNQEFKKEYEKAVNELYDLYDKDNGNI